MNSFFIHHMRMIYNAIDRWRYFFARREKWSSPLPLGVPRPMSYWSLGLYYLYSLVLLITLSESPKSSVSGMLVCLFLFALSAFLMYENKVYFGISITASFCFPKGRLYKRRSSLGRFLHAPLHFTKNTLLSQGVSPL